ncbi:hypothetical protein ACQJ9D_05525 [Helicobacter pylori]|uniref:hypothetical protein n=1 Tax=Helicobacter pylori TaxID=210 RepID=UPI0012B316BC|nr:hypothetical protein [Helicobacter pylori]
MSSRFKHSLDFQNFQGILGFVILILFQPQYHFVLLLLVFSWVLIAAFKKSLVKINIVKINNIEGLQKARAVVSKKSGFGG